MSVSEGIISELQELRDRTNALKVAKDGDVFLTKCSTRCDQVLSNLKTETEENRKALLEQFALAVLDYTFHDEDKLTEEDFPESTARQRMTDIFVYFDKVGDLCAKDFPGKPLADTIGLEAAECLAWRRGALFYMYCSTVHTDRDRMTRNTASLKKDLRDGIKHLQALFDIRKPVPSSCGHEAEGSWGLLSKGIFSDTHLLALMYCGEMCYWYVKGLKDTTFNPDDPASEFSAKDIGINMLNKYMDVTTGTLQEVHGWKTDKAEEFLDFLKNS